MRVTRTPLGIVLVLLSGVALASPPSPSPPTVSRAPSRTAKPAPYATSVQRWHAPSPDVVAPLDERGRPLLVLRSLNTTDRATLTAAGPAGGFSAMDLDRAAFVLREPSSGNAHPVEPRLLDLAYRIQTQFAAAELRVISGYRTPTRGNGSNHGKGRAIDFIVPGATDSEVASFARELGFVGVGIYPSSGFVHLDVRDRSYFWSDASGPGRRNRERGILGDLARASDRQATARGDAPLPLCALQFDVDAALRSCAVHAAEPSLSNQTGHETEREDDDPTD